MLCVVYCVRMCVVVGVLSCGVLYILYIRREVGRNIKNWMEGDNKNYAISIWRDLIYLVYI